LYDPDTKEHWVETGEKGEVTDTQTNQEEEKMEIDKQQIDDVLLPSGAEGSAPQNDKTKEAMKVF
jgi:hypothetical protein